ncbi:L-seryl-tRNA(Sec) selenium transferase [Craurococcus roseus]|uniref:L-seryl-tRNA(Sec) selenium transferase n=1 Tax=Craurococcus roseus TaxID=77585 RepID=A0ABP3Q4V7_9PROT
MRAESRRDLPAVHRVLMRPEVQALAAGHGRAAVVEAVRAGLAALRGDGGGYEEAAFLDGVRAALATRAARGLRRVLNTTGVVLHTNLGRAPLAPAALAAMAEAARGYANLEYDLGSGSRGDRHSACAALLRGLTGAEAAVVVNNCAAAVLLALAAHAPAGSEVVVSRGELVEIGGAFRVPEVVAQGGARLVEVGTTNRTRIGDYDAAIGPATRVLMRVHQSNYRVVGFTEAPEPREIAALARARGLVSVEDLGSGAVADLSAFGLPREPTLAESVAAGFDLVACSGDKLLGGPQAGLLLGKAGAVAACARHPLMRALRPDKATLAALEATLRLYRDHGGDPARLAREVPALGMLAADAAALEARAARLLASLPEAAGAAVGAGESLPGGGSLPGAALPTSLVALRPAAVGAEELARRLRAGAPPLVARIERGRVVLDVRTLRDAEIEEAAAAVAAAL